MLPEDAYCFIAARLDDRAANFYDNGTHLSLGTGLLYRGVRFPIFDRDQRIYLTASGLVYILTHECDIDSANQRPLNEDLLICPIVPLGVFVNRYATILSDEDLRGFLGNLLARRIFRAVYLPPLNPHLELGGILYFNQITTSHVSAFQEGAGAERIGCVRAIGLREIDYALENHLLRPKSQPLPGLTT